jgi:hypothetical protein
MPITRIANAIRSVMPNSNAASSPQATTGVGSNTTVGQPVIDQISRVRNTGTPGQVNAVREMKRLMKSGEIKKYYKAVIDPESAPELNDKAMKLFNSLPKLNAACDAQDLVACELWTVAPKGLNELRKSPKYLPGRKLLVPASLNPDLFDSSSFLTYLSPEEGGKKGVTCRATLVGEEGKNFLVHVPGKDTPLKISKEEVYRYNQPNDFRVRERGTPNSDILKVSGGRNSFGQTDYSDPLTKAKLCEAAIKMDKIVSKIDFNKALQGDVMGKTKGAKKVTELQRKCIKVIHDVIDMTYYESKDKEKNRKAHRPHASMVSTGRSAIKGTGKCHDHAAVNLGLLTPFAESLGVDVKMFYGHCYRAHKKGDNPFEHKSMPDGSSTGHSWLHLEFRPSMEARISDQTWDQPDLEADRAYTTRWGDRSPNRNWFVPGISPVSDTDTDMSGGVTVNTPATIFGQRGDGRENHIRLSQ